MSTDHETNVPRQMIDAGVEFALPQLEEWDLTKRSIALLVEGILTAAFRRQNKSSLGRLAEIEAKLELAHPDRADRLLCVMMAMIDADSAFEAEYRRKEREAFACFDEPH